ncbi:MAG: hypothetical protein WKF77_13885 [Planctomycetaceae bacterium]
MKTSIVLMALAGLACTSLLNVMFSRTGSSRTIDEAAAAALVLASDADVTVIERRTIYEAAAAALVLARDADVATTERMTLSIIRNSRRSGWMVEMTSPQENGRVAPGTIIVVPDNANARFYRGL